MIMRRTAYSCAWVGQPRSRAPAGTPGASCSGCCWRTPALDVGPVAGRHGGRPAGHRAAPAAAPARRPDLRGHRRGADATLAGADVVFLALPHGESAGARRPAARRTCRSSTSAPTSGWPQAAAWEHYYGGAHAGSWVYGLPELPGRAGRRGGEPPGGQPRVLPDRGGARPGPAARRRAGRAGRRRRRRRVGHLRRRPQDHGRAAGQRGDGCPDRRTRPAGCTSTRPRWSRR